KVEFGEARERLPASRYILDRSAHACLRLTTAGVGLNEIARRVGVAPSTVRLTHAERPEEIVDQIRRGSPSPYQRSLAGLSHFRCRVRCLFISNMVTLSVPKTFVSLSSARISRRFSGFCRLCERMYSQILLTTSPRVRIPA